MDMFHVDIILIIVLCFLTVFLCTYGIYCVYRLLVSLQMQILLRPTRVLFAHKKEGQSREELRTVVAYQNPFSGDYCVHKSRDGVRGYLNTTPSPDSGLSEEYEPLHQPALAQSGFEPDNHPGFESIYRQSVEPEYKRQSIEQAYRQSVEPAYKQHVESTYKQSVESAYGKNVESAYRPNFESAYRPNVESAYKPNVESAYKLNVESAYKPNVESAYKQNVESAYKQNVESAYKQNVESAYRFNLDPAYQRREEISEPAYHKPLQSRMANGDVNNSSRQMDSALMMTMDPAYHRRKLPTTMLRMNGDHASVKLTSTRSLDTPPPRVGWMTHLKSALRKPHLKTTSMPSVEDNVINKTWNWNYKEYQI